MTRFGQVNSVDSVGGGAAALLSPLVNAGFRANELKLEADAAKKLFLIEEQKQLLQNRSFVPDGPKIKSPLAFVGIAFGVVIVLIVVLVIFANSAVSRPPTIRRVRKPLS